MADELDKAIKQIAQMFGVSQNASGSGASDQESTAPRQPGTVSSLTPAFNADAMQDNLGILAKAREMLDTFNNVSDSRIKLLYSIQPFLSPARQSSCASCIQLLKIVAVMNSIFPGNQSGQRGEQQVGN